MELSLERILKESHGNPIEQLVLGDLLGAVSRGQVCVYELGHLDLVSCYVSKVSLVCGCWVRQSQDALLCLGDSQGNLQILSLAKSQVVAHLTGHVNSIVDISPHPSDTQLIASVSLDATVRLWHLESQTCLVVLESLCTTVSFHPKGTLLVTGSASGSIQEWHVPLSCVFLEKQEALEMPVQHLTKPLQESTDSTHQNSPIDCILRLETRIISKSVNGTLVVWNAQDKLQVETVIQLKGPENACRFGISLDQERLCVGNSAGAVLIYSLSGELLATYKHRRSTKPVRCCLFTPEGGFLFSDEDSVIWRYKLIPKSQPGGMCT